MSLRLAFIEIYNEKILDLLNTEWKYPSKVF